MNLSRFYRDSTLTLEEQRVYDAISQGVRAMQTAIPLPPTLRADFSRVLNAVTLDQPELFYFSQAGVSYVPSVVFNASYLYSAEEVRRKQEALQRVVAEARKHTDGLPELDKERRLHDYLARTVRYDHQSVHAAPCFTMEGALLNRCAVCAGYSRAFKFLADQVGLGCMVVHGVMRAAPEAHAWNIVRVNGSCHHVDVTNDGCRRGFVSHRYFNLSDQQFALSHTPNGGIAYPACPHAAMVLPLVSGTQELMRQVRAAAEQGKSGCQMRLSKRFASGAAIFDLIVQRMGQEDYGWYSQIKDYTYQPDLSVLTVYMKDSARGRP